MIMAILLFTSRIWDRDSDGFVVIIMRIFWWIAFGYDLYTSYLGNHDFVMSGNVEGFKELLLLLGLTLVVSASPIFASWVLEQENFL